MGLPLMSLLMAVGISQAAASDDEEAQENPENPMDGRTTGADFHVPGFMVICWASSVLFCDRLWLWTVAKATIFHLTLYPWHVHLGGVAFSEMG